jgi:hypothetical protein
MPATRYRGPPMTLADMRANGVRSRGAPASTRPYENVFPCTGGRNDGRGVFPLPM